MSRDEQANKRSNSIRVRLVPEMMDRFEVISRGFGMAPSTLAAYVIGAFVRDQERYEIQGRPVPSSVLGGLLAKDSD